MKRSRLLDAVRGGIAGLVGAIVALAGVAELPAQVVLNEILASNTFTNFDDDGQSEDWVELYNPTATPFDLAGYALSDDPLLPLKWWVPADVVVPPRGYLLIWLSGKDRFVPSTDAIEGNSGVFVFEPLFIREGDEWRYLVADIAGSGPPAGWNAIDFDDSGWDLGRSGFGYGDGDDFTELAVDTNAVFTRREFTVEEPSALSNLVLQIDYDDGFVAYLNGTRVAAGVAPAGDPDFQTEATGKHEAGTAERFDLTPRLGLLRPGKNVLAIAGLNEIPSSDMSLSPELGVVPLILHTNFRLNRLGEFIVLSDPSGETVDVLQYPSQTEDHSYGRSPNGTGEWFYFLTPTPLAANTSRPFTEPLADRVRFDPLPGVYGPGGLDVTLSAGISDLTVIHYTTDGSVPTTGSPVYEGPIEVRDNTAFRAAGFIEGERATRVASASYFIDVDHRLPILSITMDPADYATVHNTSGGRGRASEREAFMEFIEDGRVAVANGFGLRLHGGAGRGGDFDTKKAYRAYFRGVYGASKLRYPIIPETPVDEFDKLVLRSGFNDSFRTNGRATYLRDEVIRDYHEDMGALAAHGSWCILYVNMRLRGLFNIVERMDEEFMSSYLEGDDWDVIKTGNDVLVGSIDEWRAMRDFIVDNDMTQENLFQQALDLLDVENFTGYMILNMWAQNHDWPHNNWYAARRREPGSQWIFLSWDAEFGIGLNPQGYSTDTFDFVFTRNGYHREIFENLLQNTGYRDYFIHEVDRHLFESLRSANTRQRIQDLRNVVAPDMPTELQLFGRSMAVWDGNVSNMYAFAANRNNVFWNFVAGSARFPFPPVNTPRVSRVLPSLVTNVGGVRLTVQGMRLKPETEIFFNGSPAEVEYTSATRVTATLPLEAAIEGDVAVGALDPSTGEESEVRGLLEVRLPVPEPAEITPDEGSPGGGDIVRITGRYFTDGVEVRFGGVPAPGVTLVEGPGGDREIEVITPPGAGVVEVQVINRLPKDLPARETLAYRFVGEGFRRGDPNGDASIDLADAVFILRFLFTDGGSLPCAAAADSDASLRIDLADAVALLVYLFQEGDPLPAPFLACGEGPPENTLACERPACR